MEASSAHPTMEDAVTYRSLLVHAEADPARAGRLHCAASLADRFGAHVIGVGAETLPPFDQGLEGAYAVVEGSWVADVRQDIAANLALAGENFQKAMGERSSEWRARFAPPTRVMAEMSHAADLLVVRGVSGDGLRSVDTARLTLTAGRPVLHCPALDRHLSLSSVVIAWKNTREARRAVADALPMLQSAGAVAIIDLCTETEIGLAAVRAKELAAWLGRHGVKAKAEPMAHDGDTGELLLQLAEERDAELIVAGAYGHSRLGEWFFGGVTETLLWQDRFFVLLSH
jgi:nucleotide-binding universal stress UspA family protein